MTNGEKIKERRGREMLVEIFKIIISIGLGFMLGMIVTTIYVARK